METNFYDENFHGVDWQAKRDEYAKYLPFIHSRSNLRQLLNELLGELNTSHFGFYSNGKEEKVFYGSKTLATGIEFEENNPFQVKRIIKDSPADRHEIDIKAGDQLISVDGQSVDPTKNRNYYFNKPESTSEITLQFRRAANTLSVNLHPTSYNRIRTNLYDEWVDQNQAHVDQKGKEKIAYIHMKNMGGGELHNFKKEMVAEGHKRQAIILDLRYNTGGNVHDEVLRFLSRKTYLRWKYRDGALTKQSNFASSKKPIFLLINEQSLSDAEMTSQGFKELNLGTVVGTGTYRWIIFTSGQGLVDGSFYRLPSWGCYSLDGKDLELSGVEPDIYIQNTFEDRFNGNDPQLDKALEEILKVIE